MPESDEPDEEILKIEKVGVLGMAGAIGEKPVPPDVMIEAALRHTGPRSLADCRVRSTSNRSWRCTWR
jgi:hypothetical protein